MTKPSQSEVNSCPVSQSSSRPEIIPSESKRQDLEEKIYKYWSQSNKITTDIEIRSAIALRSTRVCH